MGSSDSPVYWDLENHLLSPGFGERLKNQGRKREKSLPILAPGLSIWILRFLQKQSGMMMRYNYDEETWLTLGVHTHRLNFSHHHQSVASLCPRPPFKNLGSPPLTLLSSSGDLDLRKFGMILWESQRMGVVLIMGSKCRYDWC